MFKVRQLDTGSFEIEIQPNVGTIGYLWSVMEGKDHYEYFVLDSAWTYPIELDSNQVCEISITTALGSPSTPQEFYDDATTVMGTTDVNIARVLQEPKAWEPS